jgi:hypothetical protein
LIFGTPSAALLGAVDAAAVSLAAGGAAADGLAAAFDEPPASAFSGFVFLASSSLDEVFGFWGRFDESVSAVIDGQNLTRV